MNLMTGEQSPVFFVFGILPMKKYFSMGSFFFAGKLKAKSEFI